VSHAPIIPPLAAHGHLALTESELIAWGEGFGRMAQAPLVVTISGELGAGKTTLEEVTSPTFALVHRYAAPKSPVYHLDLYRLDSPNELTNIAWDEIVSEEAIVLIEWPERAGDRIPHMHVPISLQHLPDDPSRRLLYAGGHV
jgi:tRNA threonylcarbamoyladenosine biosynthesis protein TsaE